MLPYIFVYVFYFTVIGCIAASGLNLRWGIVVASVPMIGLVFLRGLVGVDMPVYEEAVEFIRAADVYTFTFEPLFEYLILGLSRQIDDPKVILLIFSALTTVLLYFGSFKIERGSYLIALFIVPYFYLDMTMNGIRYGLAFSLVLFGAQFLVSNNRKMYLLITLIAASIQITSLVLGILLICLLEIRWRAIFYITVLGVVSFLIFDGYLSWKIEAYELVFKESETSGLAPLFLSGLTLIVFWLDVKFRKVAKIQILLLALFSIITYFVTQVSYAGLRLQMLILFLTYVYLACTVETNHIKLGKITYVLVFLIGVISAVFRLRNFFNDAGQGLAPFVPYVFFWEG